MLGAALVSLVVTGCEGEESVAPTRTLSPSGTPASQQVTPALTPTLSPTPELHPLMSGRETLQGIVTTDTGEDIRVSLSKAGGTWRFESGERWQVTRADGTVIMSGTVVGEALQYESVFGFVRLDDGRAIAYEFAGEWGDWAVYPAEEVCRALGQSIEVPAGYIKDGAIEEELLVEAVCRERAPGALQLCREKTDGEVRALAICLADLGIKEGIQIVP
ncbi:MAG: hypothetical protein A2Y61_02280 [Chloroflexi bacterium RBG_13_60_13]|nr:MAG: hypothetical protein A2Y61_02280 [Chloroflexi bacterium RBG_13_60_13]